MTDLTQARELVENIGLHPSPEQNRRPAHGSL